jgi:saccharopine dehydrogenase-like NADP-dependent oxidoreductase
MNAQKVLIIGGTGYFGRLLVDDLLRYTPCCSIVVGSRRPFRSPYFETVVADLRSTASLERSLVDVKIAVCAAGPFHNMPISMLQLCLERGIHYIDIADSRGFVGKVRSAAGVQNSSTAVCTAWSTVSALSGVLTRIATHGMRSIDSIYIHMAPGNRGARRQATIASLMHSVGRPFTTFRRGIWRQVQGWSDPRDFAFPAPVGLRRGYLVDVPDHDLFPPVFGAKTVEFRAGSEIRMFNACLSVLGRTERSWLAWSGVFQRVASVFSWMGHDAGAIGVEVHAEMNRRVSIVADSHGERIAVLPASLMTASLLSGGRQWRGLVCHTDWLTKEQLQLECDKRDFRLVCEEW